MATSMCRWTSRRFLTKLRDVHCQKNILRCVSSEALQKQHEEVEYPPVKPVYPPGKWKDMSQDDAWRWYDREQEMLAIPDVPGRIQRIKQYKEQDRKEPYSRKTAWFYNGKSYEPRLLTYQLDKTKTFPITGLPDIYDRINIEEDLDIFLPIIKDTILSEHENVQRRKRDGEPIGFNRLRICNLLMKTLILNTLSALACKHEHLLTAEFSEDIFQQACWDRINHEGKLLKLQGEYKTAFQLRSASPLPEFAPRNSEVCNQVDYPKCPYKPSAMGQFREKYTPHFLPGVNGGSPCEFGYLSVETVDPFVIERVAEAYKSSPETIPELWKGFALSSSFLSTVAQAHYQGFNTYHDITYPLTSQTVVTDGRKFLFTAYQLNTLHLWKSLTDNQRCNVFWHTDETCLYDAIEDGKLVGFNDDVARSLLKFFLLGTTERGYDLKPTILETAPVQEIDDYVEEEIIEEEFQYDE